MKGFRYWSWVISTKLIISIVYLPLMAQGLRIVFPDTGMKLSKLPFLWWLAKLKAFYRMDLATMYAIVPLVCAWIAWGLLLEMYLREDAFAKRFHSWNLARIQRVIVYFGWITIGADALLFCAAFMMSQWGQIRISLFPIVATLGYASVIGFVTFVSLTLKESK